MRAGIALGSNIEPRFLCSKVYETAPLDCPDGSPAFLNAVLEINSELASTALFACLRLIEQNHGRPSEHLQNAPRTIDLDLLYHGEAESKASSLILPHPRLATRRFVLQPLADIRP